MASKAMAMGRMNKIYPGSVNDLNKEVEPTTEPPVGPPGGLKCHKCTKGYLAFVPPEYHEAQKKDMERLQNTIGKVESGYYGSDSIKDMCQSQ